VKIEIRLEVAVCYSAKIEADYRKYIKTFGAQMDFPEFAQLYERRVEGSKAKVPKAVDDAFAFSGNEAEQEIRHLIGEFNKQQASALEQDLFKQRERLASAERTLQTKATKAAAESKRIATDKIAAALRKLDDLQRATPKDRDARVFPGQYAPVMVMEDGKRVIKPMRYQCRVTGKPANYDIRYPGTYNARRDNLEGFWKPLFGHSHGILLIDAFYENVSRARLDGRELAEGEKDENVVLEFKPNSADQMMVACLWSRWSNGKDPDLLSFAVITDDPPPEISAAGHDRCPVPVKPENVEAWLNPEASDLAAQYRILDDRFRPYYEYRLAA
jgi:putative SOS response-associated peptidase YedK